jgi:pilus assembly protein CpaB
MKRAALILALLVGALGGGLLWFYKQSFEAEVSGGRPIRVLVAAADLDLGDSLSAVRLGTRTLPEAYVEPRHIRAALAESVVGARVRAQVRAGETVLWSDLATSSPESRDLAGVVTPGMRAVAIPASHPITFDGLLRPGDRVDVLVSVQDPATDRSVTGPLLQNLIVLATGQRMGQVDGSQDEGSAGAATVTVAVWPEQAVILADAAKDGSFSFALRNPDDIRILDVGGSVRTGSVVPRKGQDQP